MNNEQLACGGAIGRRPFIPPSEMRSAATSLCATSVSSVQEKRYTECTEGHREPLANHWP
jgi:hypothetical protein